jgi:hypothetical protein
MRSGTLVWPVSLLDMVGLVLGIASRMLATSRACRPCCAPVGSCNWVMPPNQPEQLPEEIREVATSSAPELARRGQAKGYNMLKNFAGHVYLLKVIRALAQAATSQE